MGVETARKYLKNNGLVAFLSDKVVAFCVIKEHSYKQKLTQLLESKQIERHDNMID